MVAVFYSRATCLLLFFKRYLVLYDLYDKGQPNVSTLSLLGCALDVYD